MCGNHDNSETEMILALCAQSVFRLS